MMDVLRSHSAASGADVPGEREGGRIGQVPRAALRRSPGPVFWGLFVVLLLFDQASKWWILAHAADLPVSLIPGLLNLVSVRNTGIVFGLFSGYNWLWIVVGAAFLFAGLLVGRRLDWGRPEIGCSTDLS